MPHGKEVHWSAAGAHAPTPIMLVSWTRRARPWNQTEINENLSMQQDQWVSTGSQ
eukprot:COSAG02_NODE_12576_length_1523_cov_1.621489_1_plen_54_part_10